MADIPPSETDDPREPMTATEVRERQAEHDARVHEAYTRLAGSVSSQLDAIKGCIDQLLKLEDLASACEALRYLTKQFERARALEMENKERADG